MRPAREYPPTNKQHTTPNNRYRGEFEERLRDVINEASTDNNMILFIDELHTLVGAGGSEGAVDAANVLKPALARGGLRVIGATTVGEYRKHVRTRRPSFPTLVEDAS